MKINTLFGGRTLQKGLVLATTLVTCTALQANEHEDKQHAGKAGKEHADKGGPMTSEKFVQKAMAGGQMEVQMGQLGQQQAQNAEVKALAAALVKDHTQANQKLQRLASTQNITPSKGEDQAKHQKHLDKLKSQSGAEFDKEFVRMALKHHKKDISEFEKAQTQLTDQELKSFVSETLPKLRQHYQMAQAAAKTVGVDEATIAADVEADTDSAAGGAAGSVSGSLEKSNSSTDRPRSSINGATESDPSGTINQNNPSIDTDARLGDRDLSADASIDPNDASVEADVETDSDKKVFQKGDGKVLGLSTDKDDGKFLGVIPNPRANNDDADASVEVDVDTDKEASGTSATVETETKKDQ